MSVLDLTYDDLLARINWRPEDYKPILAPGEFPAEDRVAMISPPRGGKTTTVAGIFNRAISKVSETLHTSKRFTARILENASSLRQDVSDLCDGIFPAKTQFYLGFKSSPGLLVEEVRGAGLEIPLTGKLFGRHNLRKDWAFWHKARQLSITDLPGETISYVQWQYRIKTDPIEKKQTKEAIGNAITEMRAASELMFVCNCAKAHGLGLPLEQETDPNVSRNPDVSLARSFADIAEHKEKHGSRIKAVYVILAAWDRLEPRAKELDFDLFDPNLFRRQMILEDFTAKCFRQFFAELHSHGIPKERIHYYPTFFQTEKYTDPERKGEEVLYPGTVEYMLPDGTYGLKHVQRPHIMMEPLDNPDVKDVLQCKNTIVHSDKSYDQLLNDIMLNAPTVKG